MFEFKSFQIILVPLLAIVLFLGCNSVQGNKKHLDPKYQAFYDVINAVDTIRYAKPLLIAKTPFKWLDDHWQEMRIRPLLDTVLGLSDSMITHRLNDMKGFEWKQEFLINAGLINYDSLKNARGLDKLPDSLQLKTIFKSYDKLHEKYGKETFIRVYSAPMFSKDSTRCLIQYFFTKFGIMDEQGGVDYYVKVNGKWKLKWIYYNWIS